MSTKRSGQQNSLSQVELPFLKRLSPLSSPKYPTIFELASETPQTQRVSETGLFEGLLGNPVVLYEDITRTPGKYDPKAATLLTEIVNGSKAISTLTAEERGLLDQATLDFSQVERKPGATKQAARKSKPSQKMVSKVRPKRSPKAAKPRPGVDVPVTELPAFWWLL